MLNLLLYLAALVCFVIAAVGRPAVSRVNLVALGLAFWVLVPFIASVRSV